MTDASCNAILTQPDGRILIGGDFTTFNGATVNHLVRISSAGVVETAFSAGGGSDDNINALALEPDGKVLLGGDFMYFQASASDRPFWRFFGGLPGRPGTIQFSTETVTGLEGGNATLTVSRSGGGSGVISIGYSAVAGSATSADFTTTGTLTWNDGDVADKSISVPIISDGAAESSESFLVNLGEPLRNSALLAGVQRATVNITTAFDTWRAAQFTPTELTDTNISGDLADPDRDGVVNLFEFGFNLAPKTPSQSGFPTRGIQNVSGSNYLTFTFRRRTPALDLAYTPQTNASLPGTWLNNAVQVGSPVNNGDGTEPVTFRDSTAITGATKRFMHLQVTRAP